VGRGEHFRPVVRRVRQQQRPLERDSTLTESDERDAYGATGQAAPVGIDREPRSHRMHHHTRRARRGADRGPSAEPELLCRSSGRYAASGVATSVATEPIPPRRVAAQDGRRAGFAPPLRKPTPGPNRGPLHYEGGGNGMSAQFGRARIVAVCTGFRPSWRFSRNSAKENAPKQDVPAWYLCHPRPIPPPGYVSRPLTVTSRQRYRPSSDPNMADAGTLDGATRVRLRRLSGRVGGEGETDLRVIP
jgi:hypothetical protein